MNQGKPATTAGISAKASRFD